MNPPLSKRIESRVVLSRVLQIAEYQFRLKLKSVQYQKYTTLTNLEAFSIRVQHSLDFKVNLVPSFILSKNRKGKFKLKKVRMEQTDKNKFYLLQLKMN